MECRLETATDGHRVPVIAIGGQSVHLGSTVDGRYAAEVWCDARLRNDFIYNMILIGMGDLQIVWEASERLRGFIFVCEPEKSIYEKMKGSTLYKALRKKNNRVVLFNDVSRLDHYIVELINDESLEGTTFHVHPGYYREPWLEMIETVQERMEQHIIDLKRNRIHLSNNLESIIKNELRNLILMRGGILLSRLQGKWDRDIPFIIVGAGPSLKKNVEELKRVGDRACILCMDSAYLILKRAGVKPHIVVTVDAIKGLQVFGELEEVDVPLAVISNTRSELVMKTKGEKIWCYEAHMFAKGIRDTIEKKEPIFPTQKGVSSLSLAIPIELGARKVCLIGSDLAYSEDGLSHAGVLHDEYDPLEENLVDGYFGGKVYSRWDWITFREWYEDVVEADDNREYINATEGGAKIKGMKQMPLKQFVDSLKESDGEWLKLLADPGVHIDEKEYDDMMDEFDRRLDELYALDTSSDDIFLRNRSDRPPVLELVLVAMRAQMEPTRQERYREAVEALKELVNAVRKEREDGELAT